MDIEQLKQSWQLACAEKQLSQKQIEQMTRISRHPVLGRIRLKLLVEAVAMAILLLVFYDIFDGHMKPVYASVVLVMGVVFYLASNLYSFYTLKQAVTRDNILESLHHFMAQLQQAKVFSLTSLVFFSVALLVFFTSGLSINTRLILLLAGMAGATLVFLYFSARTWSQWIGRIRQSIEEMES